MMTTATTAPTTGDRKERMTTTEPGPPAPARKPSFAVRTRIAASVAVGSAVALGAAGLVVFTLETDRIQDQIVEHVEQETAELAALQRDGIDPETGRPFSSVSRLLDTFLVRNVPDDDEMLVGYWNDRFVERTPHRHGDAVIGSRTFESAVEDLLPDGGTREDLQLPGAGEYWVTVQPVRDRTDSGALVVVTFVEEEKDELQRVMRTYMLASLVLLLLVVVVSWLQAGRLLRPLRLLRDEASDISATDLSRRLPETGNDDITRLTRTFNSMLERLEDSFGSQRQFLDDAGHELRTPLTVLRGHLEVLDGNDPADVAETRELLLDEIDRMSRLVNELILLAKSHRPDFVAPQPTPVEALLENVHRKATALGDRTWVLGEAPAPDVTASLDEQRVTQALLQLCDNAVKHTRPADVVSLSGRVHAGAVELVVQDSGRGVPPEDRERIFDRFARSAVATHDEGFGLGLSIVRAIVEAHHGTVHVEDAPSGGARFVLRIPTERSD
jgi:signal transduction histidine kinase